MDYEAFNQFCKNLPATKLVRQWGDAYVWKVGDKVFAIGGWQKSAAPAFTFKTGDLDYHILKEEPGFRPAPYMAARGMKWIQYYDAACERDDELFYYIQTSHRLASLNLSKKKQKELGLIQ
ncbi:hypothetical protein A3742_11160 [Oleiphilus sp. HI0071]|jgi:predicted DNA-binding protein (MmcQ/YjbR family)|uniref:MmcQ/YjbR family DNA-binding protein n=1 Tax=unclassified Oleiphilus TaxID=2631174 RepID=UPI0007C3E8C8|nr:MULTISPECIES: MmcQ/YjbR family DNA-binding protein [unclassified Oleiphilus]KZY59870.1 hypothetical protein A3737_23560 [Oleiphilus sp. HI0065]KZY81693.1 hypothetical protein A3742_11160 [Oleiphilus sp. HI0071]KZZ00851.1 hypothetical protein A3744_11980 [Oleiphilus sp. HI0073]KZZ48218.1 hypothetical protein A3760_04105 [Oleiphilus sp. HI0122]KZZ48421.1 hypothetical protein A3758_01570 [Oleiphilus sp. HI0118]KZZ78206.1 hypothetical protein A3765_08275 [Oleiphilus sp. HI0130]KZZ79303.1 hypo